MAAHAADVGIQNPIGGSSDFIDGTRARPAPGGLSLPALMGIAAFVALGLTNAKAQDAEPRSYTNTPVGLNFILAGYGLAEGRIAFDPSLPIADAQFRTNTAAFAYVRSLDVLGMSAKLDVLLPYSAFSANGLVAGQPREREIAGFGDPRFRFSINLFGAPALSVEEFANYQQDLIIGASLQVSAPLGQYDDTKLLNLGNNRWSSKLELGISKAWGSWAAEVAPSVTIYTDNIDFYNDKTFSQAPIYALQGHILYTFQSGAWVSLDGIYFTGGGTVVNDVKSDNEQRIARAGLSFALPLDRHNSVKLYASTGVATRTGSEFSGFGIAWQYRWGEGY